MEIIVRLITTCPASPPPQFTSIRQLSLSMLSHSLYINNRRCAVFEHPTNGIMKKLLFFTFWLILHSNSAFARSAKLDVHELEVMKEIGEKFGLAGKKVWDLNQDPCSGKGHWGFGVIETGVVRVDCDCTFKNNTTCHLKRIIISSQNISASLPLEFAKFQYLKLLDLSNNYLTGAIPSEWATMRLSTLFLEGNRLSGPFPTTLTRMTTLVTLSIEGNQFSGPIPKEIANLKILENLILSSNSFTGYLPVSLAKLTKLTDLRISDNNFTGKIPNYISQWTQIGKLHIQGCSFKGPIPSSMSGLTQLFDLRISDLKGAASTFPPLEKMAQLNILVLRNCLIHGTIPDYVGNLRNLKTVDLSFNNLTGKIPPSFSRLGIAEYIYLTKNNLTGPIPRWVLLSTKNIDVSYNHFTWDANSSPKSCEQMTINVVESYASSTNKQKHIDPCLRKDYPCTKSNAHKIRSLHINCGGGKVNINNTLKYEADTERNGASSYYNGGHWAFSSTGNFLDSDADSNVYIISNTSTLHNVSTFDTELYTTARTAAISLAYYGLSYEWELQCQAPLCRDCFHPR